MNRHGGPPTDFFLLLPGSARDREGDIFQKCRFPSKEGKCGKTALGCSLVAQAFQPVLEQARTAVLHRAQHAVPLRFHSQVTQREFFASKCRVRTAHQFFSLGTPAPGLAKDNSPPAAHSTPWGVCRRGRSPGHSCPSPHSRSCGSATGWAPPGETGRSFPGGR